MSELIIAAGTPPPQPLARNDAGQSRFVGAPIPPDEAIRQFELDQYGILDTPDEPEFDDVVALAASICETPIAAVTLVDGGRQWFKAVRGLNGMRESPREVSFCAHVVAGEDDVVFVVGDAARDERFRANPLVTGDPKIRFYAGAPLVNTNGRSVGALCVIDTDARELAPAQSEALLALGRVTMSLIEARRVRREMLELARERDDLDQRCIAAENEAKRVPYPRKNLVAWCVAAGASIGFALGKWPRRS